jgi:hypothetical protein
MTVDDVFKEAQKLSPAERQELIQRLRNSLKEVDEKRPKTGAEIAAWLRKTPPVDLVDSHIEDPVEWVKAQRDKRKKHSGNFM